MKLQLGGGWSLERPSFAVDRIGLGDRANESKLASGPPFCVPHFLQPNRIMAPVIDVIHPMLAAVVIRKKLGIVEGFPRTIWLLAVSDVIRHGGQQAMGAHHLGDMLGVLAAMHIKGNRALPSANTCAS